MQPDPEIQAKNTRELTRRLDRLANTGLAEIRQPATISRMLAGRSRTAVNATAASNPTEHQQIKQAIKDLPTPTAANTKERNLHIGGSAADPGREAIHAIPGEHVDHIDNANAPLRFNDNPFSRVYTSHAGEHLDCVAELALTLSEQKECSAPAEPSY